MLRRPIAVAGALTLLMLMGGFALAAVIWRSDPDSTSASQPERVGLRGHVLPEGLAGSRAFDFDLRDARGGRIRSRSLSGRPYALTFLFTRCTDVCPVIGQDLKDVIAKLGEDGHRVSAVAISVDPRRDTPDAVRKWLRLQRLPNNFRYAIGSENELRPVWRAYYAAPDIKPPPAMSTHSASVWLVDARGRLRTRFSAGRPLPVDEVVADFRTLLAETE